MEDLTEKGLEPASIPAEPEGEGKPVTADKAAGAQRERRIFFFSFGAILFMGLALGVLYLGGRVMETKAAGKTPSIQPPVVVVERAVVPEVKPDKAAKQVEVEKAPIVENVPAPQLVAAVKPPVAAPAPAPQPVAAVKPFVAAPSATPKPVSAEKAVVQQAAMPKPAPVVSKPPADPPTVAKVAVSVVPAIHAAPRVEVAMDGNLTRSPKPYDGPFLNPKQGDRYVQVGAYSPNYTPSFLAVLERKGFHGVVAPGPAQDVYRVLLGPFADGAAIQDAFAELGKAGITDAFDRNY